MLIGRALVAAVARMFGLGALVALAGPALQSPALPRRFRSTSGHRKASHYYVPNGERECARRRKQIENRQLQVSQ
jgi:hypothetical protein